MKKIKILDTENSFITVGKEYEVIGEKSLTDDGHEAEVVIIIDNDGDEFAICNQQEATYEFIN